MTTYLLEERLSYRCSLISTRISRFITPMLEERYALTLITWRVMAVIGRYAPMSSKEVAVHTSTDAFFVSRAVEQLVARELVSRGVNPVDRRKVALALTPKGREVHHEIETIINRIEAAVVADLPAETQQAMRQALAVLDQQTTALVQSEHDWRDFAEGCQPLRL